MAIWISILWTAHALAALAALLHVLRHYRRPSAAVAWILCIVVLPLLGPLLYLAFAVYRGPRKLRRRAERRAALRRTGWRRESSHSTEERSVDDHDELRPFPVFEGNAFEVETDSKSAWKMILEALRDAREEILLGTYALHDDHVGRSLIQELGDARRRDVRVCVLLDPIGSAKLPRRVVGELLSLGVEVQSFLKPSIFKGRLQVNSRNHRKNLVVDGRIGITGGRNWGAQYFDGIGSAAGFRDLTVRISGPATSAMRRVFIEDWCVDSGAGIDDFASLEPAPAIGDVDIRVVPHGVDEVGPAYTTWIGLALREAKEGVDVLTPYFVPGAVMQHQLAVTARAGIRVRVVLAEKTDSRAVNLASRYYFEELLDAGVELVLVPPPMVHGKALLIDDTWTSVGSTNFDCRSFRLNYEMNVESAARAVNSRVREIVERIAADGQRVDARQFSKRSASRRMLENAAALFEPIL